MNNSKTLMVKDDGSEIRLPQSDEDFRIMERMADEDIVARMRGELIDAYVYQFKDPQGNLVVDLTKDGVLAYANLRKGIKLERVLDNFEDKDSDEFMVIYKAEDVNTGDTREGGAQQDKLLHNGKRDGYALAKVISKGERNALKNILNVDAWRKLIVIFLEEKEKQNVEMLKLSIHDNCVKFDYCFNLLEKYVEENFKVKTIEELEVSQLEKLNGFITSRRAQDYFLLPNELEEIHGIINTKGFSIDKVRAFVKELKNTDIEGLDLDSIRKFNAYLQSPAANQFIQKDIDGDKNESE